MKNFIKTFIFVTILTPILFIHEICHLIFQCIPFFLGVSPALPTLTVEALTLNKVRMKVSSEYKLDTWLGRKLAIYLMILGTSAPVLVYIGLIIYSLIAMNINLLLIIFVEAYLQIFVTTQGMPGLTLSSEDVDNLLEEFKMLKDEN